MAVHPDLAVSVNPVELNVHAFVLTALVQFECLTVPTDAAGQGTTAGRGGIFLGEVGLDAPVVRQVETAPGTVHKVGFKGLGRIAELEFPITGKVHDFTAFAPDGAGTQDNQQQERDTNEFHERMQLRFYLIKNVIVANINRVNYTNFDWIMLYLLFYVRSKVSQK
jgi:hypothetical protein